LEIHKKRKFTCEPYFSDEESSKETTICEIRREQSNKSHFHIIIFSDQAEFGIKNDPEKKNSFHAKYME
jgi:hypothetical protein